ncbi:ABC transporter substrate-binding protein [Streptomyces sp. NPDC048192]|jgi:polar amino acid transport system substrate-binding protein|uniref:ABC transporter substrate-binding protein n=1 Tax=Streptomyces sp. NPDC048192 TaxID=3365510 RepID=UPI0037245209
MTKFGSARGVIAAVALSLLTATGCSAGSAAGTGGSSATSAGVAHAGVLKIGTSNNMKPYAYEENGKLTGFEIDLISAAAKRLGLQPQIVSLDFSGLLPAVSNRQFDVAAAAIGITAPRKKMVDFSDGYLAGYFGVLTRAESGITSAVASVKGKRIAVLQGSIEDANAGTFLPGADIVRFPDDNSADLALKNNRVAGFFNDFEPNLGIAKKYPDLHLKQPITIPATAFPAGWAVRKGNTKLAGRLNGALKQLVGDGTWLKLYKKYFPQDPVPTGSQLPPYTAKGQS